MSDDQQQTPVSRLRRAIFTYVTTAVCIGLSFGLALRGVDTKVAQTVSEGLISLATWLAIFYVGASSVDYSLGMGLPAFLTRKRGKGKTQQDDEDEEDAAPPPPPRVDDDARPRVLPSEEGDR